MKKKKKRENAIKFSTIVSQSNREKLITLVANELQPAELQCKRKFPIRNTVILISSDGKSRTRYENGCNVDVPCYEGKLSKNCISHWITDVLYCDGWILLDFSTENGLGYGSWLLSTHKKWWDFLGLALSQEFYINGNIMAMMRVNDGVSYSYNHPTPRT